MKAPPYILFLAVICLSACEKKSDTAAPATNATNSASSPLNAPADYLKGLGNAQQAAVKVVDTTSVDKAIQLFAVENGRNPRDLNELVEQKFLSKIPETPFGTKLVYDSTAGTVKIVKQ